MIRTPQELTESISKAVNRRAVLFSHILFAITIAGHTYLSPASKPFERYFAIGVSVTLILMILLRVFDFASVNSRPRVYLIAYYVLVFFGFVTLSTAATPYTLGLFLLVFLTNLYYGSRGVIFSIIFFGFASLAKYIYLDLTIGLSYDDKLNILVAFLVFVATGSIFINIQKVFDWDRQQLHTTSRKAILEGRRLRALINNMTESVLVLDKVCTVRLYNAAALALFDTNTSLEGKTPASFGIFKDDKGNLMTIESMLPTTATPVSRDDIRLWYSDEDTAALSITITQLQTSYSHEDEETGYIMTIRDITREKSLEEERNEFISVISHELRTPVTVTEASISNSMLVNKNNGDNEKVGKALTLAHDQSIFLANMLNDLSTFARAEKGMLELNLESFSPGELATQLTTDYSREAQAKQMQIVADVGPDTPPTIASNRLYLREILQNFITNAIKYSDQGTVTIHVAKKDNGVQYDIIDQGIGISTSDQKKVFDKFFRSEDFRTRSRNGTGLGLYIVKKLAKIINASFALSSEVGKGSTFSIIVPDLSDRLSEHHPTAVVDGKEAPEDTTTPAPAPVAEEPAPAPTAVALPAEPEPPVPTPPPAP